MSTHPTEPFKQDMATTAPPDSRRGCLGWGIGCGIAAAAAIILLCGGLVAGILMLVFGIIKSSEPYQRSLQTVESSAEVQELIGSPIEAGLIPTGNVNLENSGGSADLSYTVSGPDGSANVRAIATREVGKWTFDSLTVTPTPAGEPIDLTERANLVPE
ncbi:cytochrome c oxidase assembly factor Coa1 family protein [Planctomycetaceae bacterium SH139]